MICFIKFAIIFSFHLILTKAELRCKCLMSDSTCWPSSQVWQTFNESVDGRLIPVRPTSAFCSGNPPDMNVCLYALAQWSNAIWRSEQAGAMQNYNWENSSCSEYQESVVCTQGSVPQLGVNATTVEHVQATVRLAHKHNLRLVIKTTGHDYLGRSTASDSLLLWLHYMKHMALIEQYPSCTGENVPHVIRIGAGVQWGEVYSWLSAYNLIAIGGASSTVGSIGGFLQGGGHGPLTRWQGMAADQVFEFDVVTADGQRRRVNACENKDLFWALRGGGGGTYAVVLSAVLRTFPSPSMISSLYTITAPDETRYARLIRDFVRLLPRLADVGYSGYFYMIDTNISIAFFVPNGNFTAATAIFNELINDSKDLHFMINSTAQFRSFYDYFEAIMSASNVGGSNVLLGSRLIPETIVRQQSDRVADVLFQTRGNKSIQSLLIGHLVAGGQISKIQVNNSVNPGWRNALLHMIHSVGWDDNATVAYQQRIPSHIRAQVDILQTIAGDTQSSCYMNEADSNEPNWEQKFFGTQANYNRLKSIKKEFDPNGLFICKNCVGSDDWSTDLNCPKRSTAHRNNVALIIFLVWQVILIFQ